MLSVDLKKQRIQLTMKIGGGKPEAQKKEERKEKEKEKNSNRNTNKNRSQNGKNQNDRRKNDRGHKGNSFFDGIKLDS